MRENPSFTGFYPEIRSMITKVSRTSVRVLVLVLCRNILNVKALNVTLMLYGNWPPYLVQCLPFMGPGFDLAVTEVQQTFGSSFDLSQIYVSSANVKDCVDNGAYFTDVVDYYYRRANRSTANRKKDVLIFIYAGCDDSPTFAHLGKEWNILIASCGTIFSKFRDRELFPTTLEVGPVQYDLYATVIADLCARYNWTTIGYIYDISGLMPFNAWTYQRLVRFVKIYSPGVEIQSFLQCRIHIVTKSGILSPY
ncbi:uncharacterized protein LOC129594414 [Paramacrobiotus metropolitanus]|uniref:uncharacterized protein LOC129594414 n=1 Tax=Paramacrobiotus metropolitanus TaxID=2943436 RepID=UPI002445B91D|nr:uncharacterized protein LOC129594414 [Paramacrobiotus metropolitanus]